ncbi:hypothetical protein FA048_08815 [Pedobacter polaris]|uniref:Uncharacterized protein n=1 Tax=Pedobacter polaris TaxID=2571273 RepID=A0A4U1CT93_9SPHI|nr:hypothetical protein [Pedobacter polaris]TKC10285.1 hypothetical protein FA048_08815 [Pedobacter polaris]
MRYLIIIVLVLCLLESLNAQVLKLKPRKANAITGSAFAKSIADSTLSLAQREVLILNEIKSGNVPDFLRKLKEITDNTDHSMGIEKVSISYYVLPDYFCIGSNEDFFYIPMTPILAQKVADLTKCSLPTKRMVDQIYKNATIKLSPQPIPPTKAMTTVPIFIAHNDVLNKQLAPFLLKHNASDLTAGNKKDIIISNKIYGEKTDRVVIYGWHKLDGKAIQPVYNKHTNTWADYSHGVRLVQNKVWVNGKKTNIAKVLADKKNCFLLSEEGVIEKPYYPITKY